MQIINWTGQGEGTLDAPFILQVNNAFKVQEPFAIKMVMNFSTIQNEINYIKFSNSDVIYLLAFIVSNRDSLMYYESRNAIKVTMFQTDRVDYIDSSYVVTVYNGTHYIVKQQIFDPTRKDETGFYKGEWVSGEDYQINDLVLYNNFLYACITANYDEIFTHSKWVNLSGAPIIRQGRDPLPSDYNYDVGSTWINSITLSHFILVSNEDNIAAWNMGSVRPDNETLAFNTQQELEIKNHTIEGGEWE